MSVTIVDVGQPTTLQPLTCSVPLSELKVAGMTVSEAIQSLFTAPSELKITVRGDLFPSAQLVARLSSADQEMAIASESGDLLAWVSSDSRKPENCQPELLDDDSIHILYPWQLLNVNEIIVGKLDCDQIHGTVRENVTIDGNIVLGEGSVLLPGVYIEGNAIIGSNCKIGPNCYIRGKTYIGDNCHIGQAVEVKNSVLQDRVSAGHLSYVGDTVIGTRTNLGAGTITANFRHDGKNHRSIVEGTLMDTGRRKFGCIMGEDVHTGIHTSIYPGRKIWPHCSTLPGTVVQKDIVSS